MATKKELTEKQKFAFDLYMRGNTYKEIALHLNVSEKTVGNWAEKECWSERKAGAGITRSEIVNKTLIYANKLLEKLNSSDIDLANTGKVIDQIVKLSATIQRIDKQTTVVDAIEVFQALNKWLRNRMEWDKSITPELLQQFDYYQDLYITDQINKK